MKFFLIGLATLMSMTAFANTGWEEASKITYEAETTSEIEKLLELYPSVKVDIVEAEMDVINLSYVEVTESRYKYMGETVCEATDPRLTEDYVSFTACEDMHCLANRTIIISAGDPCADGSL